MWVFIKQFWKNKFFSLKFQEFSYFFETSKLYGINNRWLIAYKIPRYQVCDEISDSRFIYNKYFHIQNSIIINISQRKKKKLYGWINIENVRIKYFIWDSLFTQLSTYGQVINKLIINLRKWRKLNDGFNYFIKRREWYRARLYW